MRTELED